MLRTTYTLLALAAATLFSSASQAQNRISARWGFDPFQQSYHQPYEMYPRRERWRDVQPPQRKRAMAVKPRKLPPEPPREALPMRFNYPGKVIVVFRGSQQYAAYENGEAASHKGLLLRGPVSTGMQGRYETTLTKLSDGPHVINYRKIHYVSKTHPRPYGGARMPFAMRFEEEQGFFLHYGIIPRWNGKPYGESHGCVRLHDNHARTLFWHFRGDVRVIVVENVASLKLWEPVVASN
jgi:L,D-transpeptidase catalytic domain